VLGGPSKKKTISIRELQSFGGGSAKLGEKSREVGISFTGGGKIPEAGRNFLSQDLLRNFLTGHFGNYPGRGETKA